MAMLHRGRGAQINPTSKYEAYAYDASSDPEAEFPTEHIKVYPKTILKKVDSPDIGFSFSLNPYQGCEHGCVYCYARETHPYWGYSAGLDFERKILVKEDAPRLLEQTIKKKSWKTVPLMLSGNTDCYQPAEQKYELTRRILEVCWRYRYPVSVITKNSLILRDLDILQQLAGENLTHVSLSITTADEAVRRVLEPRTATYQQRMRTVQKLSAAGIPVNVMIAPIIPGLTDHEILPIAKAAAEHGARSIGYTLVRLNGDIGAIFTDWVQKAMPDRAERILNRIKDCRGGKLEERRFHKRMRGEGEIAEMVNRQFKLARQRYFTAGEWPAYNLDLHPQFKDGQLSLF
jgi:DNA repair photolyase